jgi:6,7-dimethyl-8-ribityllumazine synthase
MSSELKNLSEYKIESLNAAKEMSFGIVRAEWNDEITTALAKGCIDTLLQEGVLPENIFSVDVPGTFELPAAAKMLASHHKLDAVICLGCVVKGETSHNEYINHSVAFALQQLSILSSKPFIFGVLTPNTYQQGLDRAGGIHGNKGVEAAVTALKMADLKRKLSEHDKKIGF